MTLYQALLNAGSQTDPASRKLGEDALAEQRKHPGFVSGLIDVFASDAAFEARWLAAIQLKNNIDSLWRSQLIPEEKSAVRERLLKVAHVEDVRLQRQFAVVVAKVAKIDYPRHWPTLFDDFIAEIRAAKSPQDLRVPLMLLHQCLKLISTAKIGASRSHLNEIAAPLLELLGQTYETLLGANDLDVSYTCLKAMGTLLYAGPDGIYRQGKFFDLGALLEQMLPAFSQTSKHVLRIGKIYERVADRKPVVFAMLPGALNVLELYRKLIIQGFEDNKVIIQGAAIFRALLELIVKDIRNPSSAHLVPLKLRFKDAQDKQDLATAYEMIKEYFYREGVVLSVIEAALSKYFIMTPEMIELWRDDPEEFVQEELLATHEYSICVCFQLLYSKILKAFPELGGQVMQFVQSVFESPQDILRLDAAMQALQYGSPVFSETMQLQQLFEQLLMLVNQNQGENYNVVRRRMCLLVAEWLRIQGTEELRVLVYRVVTELLFSDSPLNDLPVQLAALLLLQTAVDDFEFEAESFLPFADASFEKIYQLLTNQVQSLEVQRSILEKLCTLVEQTGRFLNDSHIFKILSILPPLWNVPSESQLIKTVIVQTLMHLVDSCRSKSTVCHSFALEVLTTSADLRSPLHSYLIEDALGLWQSLLTNADQPYPAISQLFPALVELLVGSTENISQQLMILASYIHLEPGLLTPQVSLQLLSLFAGYLPDANVEVTIHILLAVELMAKMLPARHWHSALQASGLVPLLEKFGHDTQESMVLEVRRTKVYGALSWMAIQDPVLVVQTFNFELLSDGWIQSIKSLGDPHDRKLHALGLSMCAQASPAVLKAQAPMFIQVWTLVLDEVKEVNGDAPIYHTYPGETDDDLTPEQLRLRALAPHDPVHQVDLRSTINSAGQVIGWSA